MGPLQANFDTSHNAAFKALGALEPGQQWSAFDVLRDQARLGMAKCFVTSIWNFHSVMDGNRRRTPTEPAIAQDQTDGTLWYRVDKPPVVDARKTWVAHWNGVRLALDHGIPIIGVLKDVHSGRCSLVHTFDCGPARLQANGDAIWLQLKPRGEIGCEVQSIDIRRVTGEHQSSDGLANRYRDFEVAVQRSLKDGAERRRARIATAPRLPKRVEVTSTVFDRNPDVVAEVLFRADGACELCNQHAPFVRRSNGSPYLEVHHRIRLSDDGEDHPENAIALCPNCHRKAHYA